MRGIVFAGIKGHVVALDKATGSELWRTKVKGASFVSIILDEGRLYASAQGEVVCLDPATGSELWRNRMPKLGYGIASLVSDGAPGSGGAGAAQHEQQQRQRHAAAL